MTDAVDIVQEVRALAARLEVHVGPLRLAAPPLNRVVLTDDTRVVVRVTRPGTSGASAQAQAEVDWAGAWLAESAPVATPMLPAACTLPSGLAVTFWNYVNGRIWCASDATGAAVSLRQLHAAPLPMSLPMVDPFDVSMGMLASVRSHQVRLGRLLQHAQALSVGLLGGLPRVACHGDPHFGNALVDPASGRWVWLDLQDACHAPALHDVAIAYSTLRHDSEARRAFLSAYGPVDGLEPRVLSGLLWVRSVRTAIVKASSEAFADVNLEDLVGALEDRRTLWLRHEWPPGLAI